MNKKTAYIIIGIVVLILIGVFVYLFFLSGNNGGGAALPPPSTGFPTTGAGTGAGTGNGTGGSGQIPPTIPPATGGANQNVPLLRQVSKVPTSGGVIFDKGGTATIRYLERSTGHIFETSADADTTKRITNTTIPRVYEAYFSSDGNQVITRGLKDNGETIESFDGKITGADGNSELAGSYLPAGVNSLSVSPISNQIFYLTGGDVNNTSGIVANFDGSRKIEVWRSPMTQWLASWTGGDNVSLTTKATAFSAGVSILLNTKTGAAEKILSGINGLSILPSPNSAYVLYSGAAGNAGGDISLNLRSIQNLRDITIYLKTLPEKCVWAYDSKAVYCAAPSYLPDGVYPDSWYQGEVFFDDSIWKIDPATGLIQLILNLRAKSGAEIDATNLQISADGKRIIFIKKQDLTMWEINLNGK